MAHFTKKSTPPQSLLPTGLDVKLHPRKIRDRAAQIVRMVLNKLQVRDCIHSRFELYKSYD